LIKEFNNVGNKMFPFIFRGIDGGHRFATEKPISLLAWGQGGEI